MKACVFFGHRKGDYKSVESKINKVVMDLIEREEVTQFYSGGRGAFDWLCARLVSKLKEKYPHIKLTRVLSYMPRKKEEYDLPYFDDSVYVLEKKVLPRFAIIETNKALVDKVDFVVSGVYRSFGGALQAVEYAKRKGKSVVDIYSLMLTEQPNANNQQTPHAPL